MSQRERTGQWEGKGKERGGRVGGEWQGGRSGGKDGGGMDGRTNRGKVGEVDGLP